MFKTIKILTSIILITIISGLTSCDKQEINKEEKQLIDTNKNELISFKGRQIDLKPYFEDFPYGGFRAYYEAGKLFYSKADSTTALMYTDLKPGVDFAKGQLASDIDFSKRNAWDMKYNKKDKHLYWNGDEKNDEVLNLYRLNYETQKTEKITDVDYIFAYGWNEAAENIAYVARLGTKEDRVGELRTINLADMKEDQIIRDVPEMRFSWGSVSWQPENKGVVLTALKNAHRNYSNLVYVDFEKKEMKLLTDSSVDRKGCDAMPKWLNNEEFLYISNESGFNNLYKYNLAKGGHTQLTKFEKDISECELIELNGKNYAFCIVSNPIFYAVYLVDTENGNILHSQNMSSNVSIMDAKDNKLLLYCVSNTIMFQIQEMTVYEDKFEVKDFINLPQEYQDKIVHAKVEAIEFPTFDTDPATGKQRMLHAFLYIPKNPLPEGERIVMIQSFYGGYNQYIKRNQILAEAGIYLLSPSPRGSSGFGKEFASLNDKDLGGNEIIDIIYAGKYMSEMYGIPPSRIGVFGGSHGGYSVMRLLTFPGKVNGNKAEFDWGFGMSYAGFSDIIHFYNHCNIPDWVILEAGDPETEAEKLNSRSPLYNADKMMGKLLLIHGANDNRVPVEGSRFMADSLKKYGKDFVYKEFEGQGHGIKGLKNNIEYFRTMFDFLETIK